MPHLRDATATVAPQKWGFTEKWILREAVKPFVTDEIYNRKKSQYNVPVSRPNTGTLTPLQQLLKTKLTEHSIRKLGWANSAYILSLLEGYLDNAECPVDGGLDKRARVLLCVLSFVILQDRFKIPPPKSWEVKNTREFDVTSGWIISVLKSAWRVAAFGSSRIQFLLTGR